jgi:DMSO/TMAO reductase YedYZ molybdopterin-dependent catalytic subunit
MPEHGADARTVAGGTAEIPLAVEDALVVVKHRPFNAEAPIDALQEGRTPARRFYVRSHFDIPEIGPREWRLRIDGAVGHPVDLTYDALLALPAKTITTTMECAGNDRLRFAPLPKGEPWGSGAVSTGVWRGIPLQVVLERAGIQPEAVEILFEGADRGRPGENKPEITFARSLPLPKALDPDTLLAYELNDALLTPEHGGPVRLIVPDWYGVASVKWLSSIRALEKPFDGFFQVERYILDRPGDATKEPLSTMRVKALITNPAEGEALPLGRHLVGGMAWSGEGGIVGIEVSTEGEGGWQPARLVGERKPHTWQQWEWEWEATRPGRQVLRVRATDERGNVQPDAAAWNRLGYANNSVQALVVDIRDETGKELPSALRQAAHELDGWFFDI